MMAIVRSDSEHNYNIRNCLMKKLHLHVYMRNIFFSQAFHTHSYKKSTPHKNMFTTPKKKY